MIHGSSSFLNCPRCGLSIGPKASSLTVEHCPRCFARARISVNLFSSALPAAELYPEGAVPSAEPRTVTSSTLVRSR